MFRGYGVAADALWKEGLGLRLMEGKGLELWGSGWGLMPIQG